MSITVGILGAGGWGTALAKVLAEKGAEVELWSYEESVAREINAFHTNTKYLPEVTIPDGIKASTDIQTVATGKEYILIAIPSLFLLPSIKKILTVPNIMEGQSLIGVVTKGFVSTPLGPRLILNTLEDYLPGFYKGNLVYISGPSHAEEVARGKLTGLISASLNGKNSIRFRELLSTSNLLVFSSFDVIGVQVCGATKNVIAIAFGMLDALKDLSNFVGDNTESLLLAAGLNEIQTLGRALGSTHPETFTSIAGVGDLDVTCRSIYGRNRRFGREIILKGVLQKFRNLEDLLERIHELGYLPEGAVACKSVMSIANERQLKLPIAETVFRILNREQEPFPLIEQLLKALTRSNLEGLWISGGQGT
ncbi:MAG: NAD(P)-dependent glycerol-3-phosphate dehydrogenase [Spirochaetes bacterium]|nr:NAD(P)-dependent glycerol-3-phosphate dehydrogenase [Spirochaetota bacterium]